MKSLHRQRVTRWVFNYIFLNFIPMLIYYTFLLNSGNWNDGKFQRIGGRFQLIQPVSGKVLLQTILKQSELVLVCVQGQEGLCPVMAHSRAKPGGCLRVSCGLVLPSNPWDINLSALLPVTNFLGIQMTLVQFLTPICYVIGLILNL